MQEEGSLLMHLEYTVWYVQYTLTYCVYSTLAYWILFGWCFFCWFSADCSQKSNIISTRCPIVIIDFYPFELVTAVLIQWECFMIIGNPHSAMLVSALDACLCILNSHILFRTRLFIIAFIPQNNRLDFRSVLFVLNPAHHEVVLLP